MIAPTALPYWKPLPLDIPAGAYEFFRDLGLLEMAPPPSTPFEALRATHWYGTPIQFSDCVPYGKAYRLIASNTIVVSRQTWEHHLVTIGRKAFEEDCRIGFTFYEEEETPRHCNCRCTILEGRD